MSDSGSLDNDPGRSEAKSEGNSEPEAQLDLKHLLQLFTADLKPVLIVAVLLAVTLALLEPLLNYLTFETRSGLALVQWSDTYAVLVWTAMEAGLVLWVLGFAFRCNHVVLVVGGFVLALALPPLWGTDVRLGFLLLPILALPWDKRLLSGLKSAPRLGLAVGIVVVAAAVLIIASKVMGEVAASISDQKQDFLVAPGRYVALIVNGALTGFVLPFAIRAVPLMMVDEPTPMKPSWPAIVLAPVIPAFTLLAAPFLNPGACEAWRYAAVKCDYSCSIDFDELQQGCEQDVEGGFLAETAARTGKKACSTVDAYCQKKLRAAIGDAIREDEGDDLCEKHASSMARDACGALVEIGHNGRSTSGNRKALRDYLEARGYSKLWGYIIARHDPGVYEAAYMTETFYGYVPSKRHFILRTSLTNYSTKGRFTIWARQSGTNDVTTKSGFNQTWKVFDEDAFGSVVESVFDAPAGDATSDAARSALEALLGA